MLSGKANSETDITHPLPPRECLLDSEPFDKLFKIKADL